MRIFRRSFLIMVVSVLACFSAKAQTPAPPAPASMVAGVIKASNVRGDVKKVNLTDKTEVPLRNGDTLQQNHAVVTAGGQSSVVLVFANGSTVRVGHDSRLEISEFLMDPLQADISNVAALTNEPTTSRTNLRLEFGEMVGNVKTLNRAAGSSFSVSTPAGAAGIRGTIFRIVYRPTGNGQAFNFTLSTSEGVVLFEGTTTAGAASVQVPVGREVTVVATVDAATNTLVISPPAGPPSVPGGPPGAAPISNEAAAALQTATAQIIQVQQQTNFRQVEFQGPPAGGPNPPVAPKQQVEGKSAPLPPTTAPRTTPGDGR
jgi:hypothetical protein